MSLDRPEPARFTFVRSRPCLPADRDTRPSTGETSPSCATPRSRTRRCRRSPARPGARTVRDTRTRCCARTSTAAATTSASRSRRCRFESATGPDRSHLLVGLTTSGPGTPARVAAEHGQPAPAPRHQPHVPRGDAPGLLGARADGHAVGPRGSAGPHGIPGPGPRAAAAPGAEAMRLMSEQTAQRRGVWPPRTRQRHTSRQGGGALSVVIDVLRLSREARRSHHVATCLLSGGRRCRRRRCRSAPCAPLR